MFSTGFTRIMATDPGKTRFLVGECKFQDSPLGVSDMNALISKESPEGKAVYHFLFSKSGFTDDTHKRSKQLGVQLVDLDGIVQALEVNQT